MTNTFTFFPRLRAFRADAGEHRMRTQKAESKKKQEDCCLRGACPQSTQRPLGADLGWGREERHEEEDCNRCGGVGGSSPPYCLPVVQLPGELGGGGEPGRSGIRTGAMVQAGLTHDELRFTFGSNWHPRRCHLGCGCSHESRQLTALTTWLWHVGQRSPSWDL